MKRIALCALCALLLAATSALAAPAPFSKPDRKAEAEKRAAQASREALYLRTIQDALLTLDVPPQQLPALRMGARQQRLLIVRPAAPPVPGR
jgi:hypothetical protein